MSSIAVGFGVLLSILGGVIFALAEVKSPTALIPAYVGVALILLGLVARSDKWRMHAMHIAALLGLLGLVGGIAQGIRALIGDRPPPPSGPAASAWPSSAASSLSYVSAHSSLPAALASRKIASKRNEELRTKNEELRMKKPLTNLQFGPRIPILHS